MPKVCIVTPMRDCAAGIDAYIARLYKLQWPVNRLHFVIVEGDSIDDTPERLRTWAAKDPRVTVITHNTGKPRYGSIIHPVRFEILASVFNAGIEELLRQGWADYMQMLPADVAFGPELVSNLVHWDRDVIAPLFWHRDGFFYDTWGFGWPHYTRDAFLAQSLSEPLLMEHVGGAKLAKVDVLRAGVRYTIEEVDRGFCRSARSAGYEVWADPTTHITHL